MSVVAPARLIWFPLTVACLWCADLAQFANAGELIRLEVAKASVHHVERTKETFINVVLTGSSGRLLATFTERNVDKRIDIRVEGRSFVKPFIREAIYSGSVQLSGLSLDESQDVARRLSAGARIEMEVIE